VQRGYTMAWSRTSRHERGYGTAWDKLRKRVLDRDRHLCQPCLREGRVHAATHVDHIVSKAAGGTDDESNLQAINVDCHQAKTAQDSGRSPKRVIRIGPDGWPL